MAPLLYKEGLGEVRRIPIPHLNIVFENLSNWPNQTEYVKIDAEQDTQRTVKVSFMHERKFARLAAAKAKTGAEIVNLTYRQDYLDDPTLQWQGYEDNESDRHWGVSDWARRSFVGSYFDWAFLNSALPSLDDEDHVDEISKIDRGVRQCPQ